MKKVHNKDTLYFCKTHSSNRHSAILSNAAHKILFISRHVVWLHTSLPITVTIYLHFSHPLSFTSSPPLVFSSSGPGGWLQLFFFLPVHFLVRGRLSSAARAILSPNNTVFSLTLIKVHLASKCCRPLNTDCTERRKWKKRQSKWCRQRESAIEIAREHHVDNAERNNGLMVIESRQNNHCSPPNPGVM